VAANRDEQHARASAVADYWHDHPHILAGRDLEAGGTWLGCTRTGRFAALTNFTNPEHGPRPVSRGLLVQNFLATDTPAQTYANSLEGNQYAGFNLLLFDGESLVYTTNAHPSNRAHTEVLKPGYYGLSNAELGAEWPKCVQGASALRTLSEEEPSEQALLALLRSEYVPPDAELPQRGRPVEFERRAAPCFIHGDTYGTRASTLVRISDVDVRFTEQSFAALGEGGPRVDYQFTLTE